MRLFLNTEVDTTEMFGFSPYSYNAFYGMNSYLLTQNNDLITLNDVIETNFDGLFHELRTILAMDIQILYTIPRPASLVNLMATKLFI